MSIEQVIEETERRLRELKEQKRLQDIDDERSQMERCQRCGEPIPEGHVFCVSCEKERKKDEEEYK